MTTKTLREARLVECNGAAHSNPFIDNCMVCLPFWGTYPVCPDDNIKLKKTEACGNGVYYCRSCRRYFTVFTD